MSKSNKYKVSGPRMLHWVVVNPVMAILLCVFIFITNYRIRVNYGQLSMVMYDYSECNKAIQDFKDASDYLTDQVRFFALTHEPVYLDSYFYEVYELNRRELAVEIIQMTHVDDDVDVNIRRAFKESTNLSYTELYSIRLVCEASGFNVLKMPELLREVKLSEADSKLTPEEMYKKAQSMVYNYSYLTAKAKVMRHALVAQTHLINSFVEKQNEVNNVTNRLFILQYILIAFLVVFFIAFCGFTLLMVMIPIRRDVVCIENSEKMKLKGASEVRYIAKAYNALCDKNSVTESVLKHKAEHDPLTGLINREAFTHIQTILSDSDETIAYLIIDIDLFKGINDEYGHLVGDDVLRKISELLMEQFRSTDYVARIGGDEFAVIMTKIGSENPTSVITSKIAGLNNRLMEVDDGLPPVSLSVGVSISNNGFKNELLAQADEALYRVKNSGRCNCAFY